MIRRRLPALALLLALLTLAVPACSGGEELPDGQQLLSRSGATMGEVSSARFVLDLEGDVSGLPIEGAQGQLTRDGEAAGTAGITQGGELTELEFVLTGDKLYLQGPTGGFRELPASFAASVYDPSTILDARRGVPALLENGTDATTEAREDVDGVDAYRVRATFPVDVLGGLIPAVTEDTEGQVWIGFQQPRLVQARFELPGGIATVRLSEFDAPVDIAPPS
ncbi:MAG: LppX_LprAFG lipoprotein [Pseudonocardiaceae bacterium]|nr:LppX_LprAFG lipoprotein [Pseudonocardiaceae bacterium]